MYPPQARFDVPPGEVAEIKIIDTKSTISCLPATRLMSPELPGFDYLPTMPSLSFLIKSSIGVEVLFDLSISKDWRSFAPIVSNRLTTNGYQINVTQNTADVLVNNTMSLKSIKSIIWSHWHWDHIGDPSQFPTSTEIVVGPGFKTKFLPAWPKGQDSPVRESDFEGRTIREISFDGNDAIKIGRFRAIDFFRNGSFYILDTPGHAIGHLGGLVRTTKDPDTFIFLGGDLCHHSSEMRPSQYQPMPSSIKYPISSAALYPCPGAIVDHLQRPRGRTANEPFFDPAGALSIPEAIETLSKAQEADGMENVLFIYAHESSIVEFGELFPLAANEWKRKGWREKMQWAFLRDFKTLLER